MVSKITIFELHVDDARFGTNDTIEDAEPVDSTEFTPESGPSVGRLVLASLLVSVVATLVARRLFGGTDDTDERPIEIDTREEAADIELEH
ncbi:MAG: hypothetical protein ABEI57_05500 [Halapricum sp.]